jgi:hypothetical protein
MVNSTITQFVESEDESIDSGDMSSYGKNCKHTEEDEAV